MRKFLQSFRYALAGLAYLFRTQRNARVHTVAALLVVGTGFYFDVSRTDWTWLIVAIAMVFAAEAFNTALELLADRITTEADEKIRRTKDTAAAAVLIAAIGAAAIGLAILGPYFLQLFGLL